MLSTHSCPLINEWQGPHTLTGNSKPKEGIATLRVLQASHTARPQALQ